MVSQIPSGSQATLRNTVISASRALHRGTYTFFSRTPLQFFLTFFNTLQLQPLPSPCFWLLNTLLILTFSFFLINCQSLAISHHSCVAPSVPCSTLSRVRQAKGKKKKKKQTTRGWVSREKFMLSPVSVSSITVGTGSENNCRETVSTGKRHTLCLCRAATSAHVSGHMWSESPIQRFREFGGQTDEGFPTNVPVSLCSTLVFHTESERHVSVTKAKMPNTCHKMWRK